MHHRPVVTQWGIGDHENCDARNPMGHRGPRVRADLPGSVGHRGPRKVCPTGPLMVPLVPSLFYSTPKRYPFLGQLPEWGIGDHRGKSPDFPGDHAVVSFESGSGAMIPVSRHGGAQTAGDRPAQEYRR